jgi:hypothetical protein
MTPMSLKRDDASGAAACAPAAGRGATPNKRPRSPRTAALLPTATA